MGLTADDLLKYGSRKQGQIDECGRGMELVQLYHPDRGMFFDLLAEPDR